MADSTFTHLELTAAWNPLVAIGYLASPAEGEQLAPSIGEQSYTSCQLIPPQEDWAALLVALPTEAEIVYLLAADAEPLPTAVEHALWFFDSHPEIDFLWGAGGEGSLQTFRPAEFLKKPELLGESCFVRRAVLEGSLSLQVALATAIGRGSGGAILGVATEREAWTASEPAAEAADLFTLAAQAGAGAGDGAPVSAAPQPRHDAFRKVPQQLGPGAFPPKEAGAPHAVFLVPHFALGGSDKFNLDLAYSLTREHGYRVSFVSTLSKESDWEPAFQALSGDLHPLQKFLTRPDFPRFIASHIRSREADLVIIAHSTLAYQCLPYLRASCPGTAFVDYLHIVEEEWREGGYPGLSCQYADFLDRSLVSSEELSGWLQGRGREASDLEVVTTNIDPQQWDPASCDTAALREKYQVPASDILILFAGRLVVQKQPDVLAATLALLEADPSLPSFTCLVAGDGEERETLEATISKQGLRSVRLLGQVEPDELRGLLAAADLFFLPSRNEGIALALFEAMAMRCVVVGAVAGGQRELVTEDCGRLINPQGDAPTQAARYAEVLKPLLTDSDLRSTLAETARCRIEQGFTLRQMGERFVTAIRDLKPREFGQSDPALLQIQLNEVIEGFRLDQEAYRLDGAAERLAGLEQKNAKLRDQLLALQLKLADPPEPREKGEGKSLGSRVSRALRRSRRS